MNKVYTLSPFNFFAKKVPMAITNIDLNIVIKRVAEDNPALTCAELKQAEAEYRNYWLLMQLYPDEWFTPTELADKVWHMHVLFTKKYAEDCQQFFGYFLHHCPFTDRESPALREDMRALAKKLYEMHFGSWPSTQLNAGDCYVNDGDPGDAPPTKRSPGKRLPVPGPVPSHESFLGTVN